jgi:hypothetical protein
MNLKYQCILEVFESPSIFFNSCNQDLNLQNSFQTIVTDFHFGEADIITGLEFAKKLRNNGFAGKILLASSGEFSKEDLGFDINGISGKVVKEIKKLL